MNPQTAARTAAARAATLNQIAGVVDNGLSVGLASRILVGRPDGTTRTIE